MNILGIGAGILGFVCGGFLLYIFLLGPLAYIISAAVHKIEGRNYLKALGVAGLSIVANIIIHLILKQFMHGFGLWLVAVLVNAVVAILFVWLFYHVGIRMALTVWLLAFGISIGIVILIGLLVLIFAGSLVTKGIQQFIQQFSFVFTMI